MASLVTKQTVGGAVSKGHGPSTGWGRVFLVGIGEQEQEFFHSFLKTDCTLVRVNETKETLSLAQKTPPEVFILSSSLLSSDFWEQLRKQPELADVPTVFLIEGDPSGEVERTLRERSIEYFKRPLDLGAIRSRLRNLLALQRRIHNQRLLNNARWRFALDGSEFGVWDWDIRSGLMSCSASLCQLIGLTASEQELSREQWLRWTHPDDRERVEEGHRALQSGQESTLDLEYRLVCSERPTVWVHERGRTLQWIDGVPSKVMAVLTDTTQRRTSERRLVKLANYDSLTDLPNRKKCLQFISEAVERAHVTGGTASLYRIDLGGLAEANHSLGRRAGDEILKQAANRLRGYVAAPEHVCRLGGKEFALIGDRSDPELAPVHAAAIANEIAEELARPYQLGGESVSCFCDVGACVIEEDIENPEEAIRRAEIALDEARRGKNTAAVFHAEMLVRLEERTQLLRDLKRAVFTDEFHVAYQPIVEGRGRIVGVEALARWHHPVRGRVPPSEFIPLAEESGLMVPLGVRLRRQICSQLAAWAKHPATAKLIVSANVSPVEFRATGFARDLVLMMKNSGISPQLFQLEVTESLLMSDFEGVSSTMNQLRESGIRFVLDDFGTGYSALTYLKRLPFERLKLDRSFVRDILTDPIDASLSRAILAMAQNLGLEAVAEGVEEESQVKILSEMGCSKFQGYLFSKPKEAPEIEALCRQSLRSPASIFHAVRRRSTPPISAQELEQLASILVVDDDPTTLGLLKRILKSFPNLRATQSPLEAKRMVEEAPPDLLLLDTKMPELNGFELLEAIRQTPGLGDIPAIFVTALLDPETELRALAMGAADFVSKPISAARLKLAVRNQIRIKRQTDSLRRQASADPLTGIANRRSFDRALAREVARAIEAKTSLSLLMVDVDRFKAINDEQGHPTGDSCLSAIATVLTKLITRPVDLVARYGGEEFGIVLPLSNEEQACHVAETIVTEVQKAALGNAFGLTEPITVSVGWATIDGDEASRIVSPETHLLDRADRALLMAKEKGRNRVCGPLDLIAPREEVS